MMDLLPANAPWQIDLLLVETLLSAVFAIFILANGFYQQGATLWWYVAWNLSCVALILTGGSSTWQHYLYLGYAVVSLAISVRYAASGTRRQEPAESMGVAVFLLLILTLATWWVLVAGVA